jgi:hypothetical protein
MKHLSVGLLAAIAFVAGVSSADALVLCVNASGSVTALPVCKPGWTQLDLAATGLVGPPGPAGPQGPTGPEGPAGSNELHFVSADFGSFVSLRQFIQLDLPAGTFLVTAKTYISSAFYGGCNLVSGAEGYETYYDSANYDSGAAKFAAVMFDKITLAAPSTVGIRCGNGLGATTFWESPVLFAIPVAE